ncbi:hypothetical protein PG993_012500 [Apiospora rasikravindrae]|uniref:peptidylprolyl isomerase n=1 Tax=Apiospora rasikravindrae TaxID=990691 RepID=A0ABR1S2N2_9PEZI
MQRYTVTILAPGAKCSAILVPFQPSALVAAFVDELYKRAVKNGSTVAKETHLATLHLDSNAGPVIDPEDLLSDIVQDPRHENLFVVFTPKGTATTALKAQEEVLAVADSDNPSYLHFRIVTAANVKEPGTCPLVHLPRTATIRQLRDNIADELGIPHKFDEDADLRECNCQLAQELTQYPIQANSFLVVHGKSIVERVHLEKATDASIYAALQSHFGSDLQETKNVTIRAGIPNQNPPATYIVSIVVAVCSKERHRSTRTLVEEAEPEQDNDYVMDLHTAELPIHPSSMDVMLENAGLGDLTAEGIIDIYCVSRRPSGDDVVGPGKSSIFRVRPHWDPIVAQSNRGKSIFLSSLWVFTSLVHDMKDDESSQDSVLHVFDRLTSFPPALRTLYMLIQGMSPTAIEIAALCQAMYEVLDGFMATFTETIGSDHSRVFEGARLLFGFMLEKAKTLRASQKDITVYPYSQNLRHYSLRDHRTHEGLLKPHRTSQGLMEASLAKYLQTTGLLGNHEQQVSLEATNVDPELVRIALLSGGMASHTVVLSRPKAPYVEIGVEEELKDLDHLSEVCARNKLTVHMPGQLTSSVAPGLTLDSPALLAVHIDGQGCGIPGNSSTLFSPCRGEQTMDVASLEQLVASLLRTNRNAGTAAFDQYSGAAAERLLAPDEILLFCVDTSASMGQDTDFSGTTDLDEQSRELDVEQHISCKYYQRDTTKLAMEALYQDEGFSDMIAMVAQASPPRYPEVAAKVLNVMRSMMSTDIFEKSGNEKLQEEEGCTLNDLKYTWANLKTHEEALINYLMYHAITASPEISQRWIRSKEDEMPAANMSQRTPTSESYTAYVPPHLRCPLSRALLLDAVRATDGHIYSQAAITRWFYFRKVSPLTGEPLQDTEVRPSFTKREAARLWMHGDGIPLRVSRDQRSPKRPRPEEFEVTFDSQEKSFRRKITPSMTLEDLYELAFRGLEGRVPDFQLSTDQHGSFAASSTAISRSLNIGNGSHVRIRTVEGNTVSNVPPDSAPPINEQVLVKVYDQTMTMLFSYWVHRDTDHTISSVIWKYWRYCIQERLQVRIEDKEVRTDLTQIGDGLYSWTTQRRHKLLSTLLNTHHCHGNLGDESVFAKEGTAGRGDGPLVLKLCIASPQHKSVNKNKLSRLEALKQMLEGFIDRTLAYSYKPHVGLVTFGTKPILAMGLSHALESFQQSIDHIKHEGDTALWDALDLGVNQLIEYGKVYPHLKKRIVCISDGLDTSSDNATPAKVLQRMREAGIVVDSISLGAENEDNSYLRTLSYLTDGYRFHPMTLTNALAICELEPFLSLTERPTVIKTALEDPSWLHAILDSALTKPQAGITEVNKRIFPNRREHPNMQDNVVQLKSLAKMHQSGHNSQCRGAPSNIRTTRLLNEIRDIANNAAHPMYDIYVSESDMGFWKIVMSGPEGTPYSGGTFLLCIHVDEGYPSIAPVSRFITKIWHPNVGMHGRVCHSILDCDWSSDISMTNILNSVYALLFQPEHNDAVNTTATLKMHHDKSRFETEVQANVRVYATKSREEWRRALLGSPR